jgi:hypothetical protein
MSSPYRNLTDPTAPNIGKPAFVIQTPQELWNQFIAGLQGIPNPLGGYSLPIFAQANEVRRILDNTFKTFSLTVNNNPFKILGPAPVPNPINIAGAIPFPISSFDLTRILQMPQFPSWKPMIYGQSNPV